MEKIIEVNNLETWYGKKKVLDGINVDFYKNQINTILGTSGCGKTTLLKHIIGLLRPRKGSIKVFGEEVSNKSDIRHVLKKIGVLFQNGALLNSLTTGENISLPLEMHTNLSKKIIKRIVMDKLHLVDLGPTYNLLPQELSGGMRKRAALARAMVMDPEILFCDEPSAGLDPVTAKSLDELLLNLKNKLKMTIVMVTHEIASIKRVSDNIVMLDKGRVVYSGNLEKALSSSNESVKNFFHIND